MILYDSVVYDVIRQFSIRCYTIVKYKMLYDNIVYDVIR